MLCPPATVLPTANAYQRRCADCPDRVWVVVDLCALVMAGDLEPLCLRCARRMVAYAGESALGLMPEQVEPVSKLGFEVTELAGMPVLAGGARVLLMYLSVLEQHWHLNGTAVAWL